jgi:hypothetical protein|tara:strand:+ start:2346 stop:3269 length:924 start_codon:yes stop_codon:yes gene_type:complete
MKRYILINGQNKVQNNFLESSKVYNKLLECGYVDEVIITCWVGEINHIKQLSENFTILPVEKPKMGMGFGNIWAQMSQYDKGLNFIKNKEKDNEEVFVLRTRPDIYIKENFIKDIFKEIEDNRLENEILNHKVWISYFDISKPFYMAGDCWGGNLEDMLSFVNYRSDVYTKPFQGISHVRIYVEPFLESYPILVDYLKNKMNCCQLLVEGKWENRKKNILNLYKTDFYRNLLSVYYEILNNFFIIKNEKESINFRYWNIPYNPNTLVNDISFESNIRGVNPYINTFIFGYDNNFIKKYLNDEKSKTR